ncbi:lipase class 3 family protein [Phlegmacium glaucopus]|nr:lipase class 3 family protein [Phlegmacium glaucopus]
MLATDFILASLLASVVSAASGHELAQLSMRQSITTLSSSQISSFKPFTFFAGAAYCNPSTTIDWSCGPNCAANSDFIPVASGGDGSFVQFWYVGFSPSQGTVIVAHQGTDVSEFQAGATDANAFLESLDPTLFPGVSPSVEVHSGFANEQAKTATEILSAVKTAIAAHGATKVTIVGHSLGAAIAVLDGVYLSLHINGVSFRMIGYGMPRVGNQDFADYLDAHLNLTHINNKKDFVPIIPGRFFGYRHPSGEVHIMENNKWASCPGQDNPSTECAVAGVPNTLEGSVSDHIGPYDGVMIVCYGFFEDILQNKIYSSQIGFNHHICPDLGLEYLHNWVGG